MRASSSRGLNRRPGSSGSAAGGKRSRGSRREHKAAAGAGAGAGDASVSDAEAGAGAGAGGPLNMDGLRSKLSK